MRRQLFGFARKQIRSSYIAYKQYIAAKYANRLGASGFVRHDISNMLRSMSGRVQHFKLHIINIEPVPFGDCLMLEFAFCRFWRNNHRPSFRPDLNALR